MRRKVRLPKVRRTIPGWTAALVAAGVLTSVNAQIQTAGTLFVNVDATGLTQGPLNSITNTGTLGGVYAATGSATEVPTIATVGGTKAIQFDGTDYLQLMDAVGGSPILAPPEITGEDPTHSIEVWALNPDIATEESLVSWGHRGGGPDGSNVSFNYGNSFAFGAVGHWGNADIGWNDNGGAPAANHWHHLVYTYDGTTTRVYADGALVNGEFLGAGAINTHPDTWMLIGAQSELAADAVSFQVTGGLRLTGAIGRVRVHDGVLSPAQVLNNYNFEKAAFIDPVITTPPPILPERLSKAPVHRYSFNEPAGDATGLSIVDSVAAANGTVQGDGATFTGTRLVLPGGPSATQAYADLPNGLLSSNGVANAGSGAFTFETWFKHTGSQTWSRIFDFGSSGFGEVDGPGGGGDGTDYLMYSAQIGGDTGSHRLEVRDEDPGGGGIVTSDNQLSTFGTDTHIVVTWDEATGKVTAYENGVQVNTLTTPTKLSDINDVNVWLGRSNWSADQDLQGEYDEARFYDYVLTPGQVLGNSQAGADILNDHDVAVAISSQPQSLSVPETAAATFRVAAVGSSPVTIQWLRNGTPIQGANSATYTIPNVTAAENNAVFTAEVSNTVNGSVVKKTSNPVTLTVLTPTVTLAHRYSFNETGGTTVSDSVGGADGTVVDDPTTGVATFGGGELTLDGVDSYVNLPNGIITGLGTDGTFELWVTHQSPAVWARIFDFGNSDAGEDASGGGVDFLFFTPRDGDGLPRFTANFPGGGDVATIVPAPPGWIPGNEQKHIVVTWAASGNTSRLYIDGVLVGTRTAPMPLSAMNGQDVNNWLGRSQFVADAYWGGKYNEVRLYSGAMTPSQVQASFAAGPDAIAGNAPSLTTQVSGKNLTISWPASATGYALESSSTLGTGAAWTAVGGATQVGNNMQVTVPIGNGNAFYRLKKP
jgi:hypothetical protein